MESQPPPFSPIQEQKPLDPIQILSNTTTSMVSSSTFVVGSDDISPINGIRDFFKEFRIESKKLWYLAAPAILTSICNYSLGAITQTFAGHVSTLDLDAFSVENSVIAGFALGILVGMGSALETLCGQAYGAGQKDMLGIYMQRSWIILMVTAILLMSLYIFATPLLFLIGQRKEISNAAGKMAIWMIPQLFAYAFNYPIVKFLQAQSKMKVSTYISVVTLGLHAVFSWLFMLKLRWGLAGGAAVLNCSWWLIVVAQLVYIFCGSCGRAWSGFSLRAFQDLWSFIRISLASALMLCLEVWYYMALILFAGYLKNAQVGVASLSICINIVGWGVMISLGFNAAISVRVSNELGAAHPRTAKFSIVVVIVNAFFVALALGAILLIFQKQYPALFSNNEDVRQMVYKLTGLLVTCVVINNIQPVLSGVAIGAGWQAVVGYVNVGCYYIFGAPLGLLLGFKFDMGIRGIWIGMLTGTVVQTLILAWMVYRTNWNKEASIVEKRMKQYGKELNAIGNNVGERNGSA